VTPDVLFGQAYFLRFDPKLWSAQQPYAPLGALYAAACVREHGYSVELFDAMLARSEAEWTAALDRSRPRFAVIYEDSFNYLTKMCLLRMRDAATTMIASARERGVPTLVAGSDATDHPEIYLDAGAELVVTGEGEQTVVDALDVLSGRTARPLADVPGLCIRQPNGVVLRTKPREFIRNLDALPRPAWDLIEIDRYRSIWMRRHGYFSMNVATTRGCPYHCNWCAKPIYGQRYAARSPAAVVAEIAWLKDSYRPDHLWVVDDIFGLKPGWIGEFASAIEERLEVRTPFKCLLRADGVDSDSARALAAAGCRTAWIGAESGSQRILDAMEKGIRVDQIVDATRHLRSNAIQVGFFLQFGYPGETLVDIERTIDLVRHCRPDDIGVSVSYPLPGTVFFERVRAQLGRKQNWRDSDDLAVMYQATYCPDFYRALHALVHAEFRFRNVVRSARRLESGRTSGPQPRRSRLRTLAAGAYDGLRLPILRRRNGHDSD
jgi:anaerobic magnesium-protoporphyrin IX monomethyl ester cyclase